MPHLSVHWVTTRVCSMCCTQSVHTCEPNPSIHPSKSVRAVQYALQYGQAPYDLCRDLTIQLPILSARDPAAQNLVEPLNKGSNCQVLSTRLHIFPQQGSTCAAPLRLNNRSTVCAMQLSVHKSENKSSPKRTHTSHSTSTSLGCSWQHSYLCSGACF